MSHNESTKPLFESLEERVLLSASPIDDAASDQAVIVNKDLDSNRVNSETKEILIVDTSVENYQDLVTDISKQGLTVYLIDPASDGLDTISEIIASQKGLTAIHIVSHGSTGEVQLGSSTLSSSTLEAHSDSLSSWSSSLAEGADLLFYACDLAQDSELAYKISELTQADVAASDDLTGFAGDTTLELQTGAIETDLLWDQESFDEARISLSTEHVFSGSTQAELETLMQSVVSGDTIVFQTSVNLSFDSEISMTKAVNLKAADGVTVTFDGQYKTRILSYDLSATENLSITGDIRFVNANTVDNFVKVTTASDLSLSEDNNAGSYYSIDDYLAEVSDAEKAKYVAVSSAMTFSGYGAALYVKNAHLTLDGVTVQNSFAFGQGAGLYHSGGSILVQNSSFIDNHLSAIDQSNNKGAAIFTVGTTASFENNTITNNTLTASSTSKNVSAFGAGIYSQVSASASFINNTISNNILLTQSDATKASTSYGAGVYSHNINSSGVAQVSFLNNKILDNKAIAQSHDGLSHSSGAGVFSYTASVSNNTSVIFKQNLVNGNVSTALIKDIESTVSSSGAGLFIEAYAYNPNATSLIDLAQNSITENTAQAIGGEAKTFGVGLVIKENSTNDKKFTISLSNNTIAKNSLNAGDTAAVRQELGAGLYLDSADAEAFLKLNYNTIYENTLSGNATADSESPASAVYLDRNQNLDLELYGNLISTSSLADLALGGSALLQALKGANNVLGDLEDGAFDSSSLLNSLIDSVDLDLLNVTNAGNDLLYYKSLDIRLVDQGASHTDYSSDIRGTISGDFTRDIGSTELTTLAELKPTVSGSRKEIDYNSPLTEVTIVNSDFKIDDRGKIKSITLALPNLDGSSEIFIDSSDAVAQISDGNTGTLSFGGVDYSFSISGTGANIVMTLTPVTAQDPATIETFVKALKYRHNSSYTPENGTHKLEVFVTDEDGLESDSIETTKLNFTNDRLTTLLVGEGKIGTDLTVQFTDEDGTVSFSYKWQKKVDGNWLAIAGEVSNTLSLDRANFQVGDEVRVIALNHTDSLGNVTATRLSQTVTIALADDVATEGEVTIDHTTLAVGSVLTANSSALTDANGGIDGDSFTYQWQFSVDGLVWNNLSSTSETFTITASEQGLHIRVIVGFSDNDAYTASKTSAALDIPVDPVVSGTENQIDYNSPLSEVPIVSPDFKIDDVHDIKTITIALPKLTSASDLFIDSSDSIANIVKNNTGTLSFGGVDYAFKVSGKGKNQIITFTPTEAQSVATTEAFIKALNYRYNLDYTPESGTHKFSISVTNEYGLTSNSVETTKLNFTNDRLSVLLVGEGKVGTDLTVQFTDDDGTASSSYKWQKQVDGKWLAIAGTVSNTLSLDRANFQAGDVIRVIALNHTDSLGNVTATRLSQEVTVVVADDVATDGSLTIDYSDLTVGSVLTANTSALTDANGGIDGDSFTYQWQSSVDGVTWTNLSSTDQSFTITASEQGLQIRVIASFNDNDTYMASKTSTSVEAPLAPVVVVDQIITKSLENVMAALAEVQSPSISQEMPSLKMILAESVQSAVAQFNFQLGSGDNLNFSLNDDMLQTISQILSLNASLNSEVASGEGQDLLDPNNSFEQNYLSDPEAEFIQDLKFFLEETLKEDETLEVDESAYEFDAVNIQKLIANEVQLLDRDTDLVTQEELDERRSLEDTLSENFSVFVDFI